MTLSTFRRLRKEYPAQRGETMASYFERLSKSLQELNEDVRRVEE